MVVHALRGSGKREKGEILWEGNNIEAPGGVSFRELVSETVKKKRVPRVVCEFGGISVGGAFVGGGIESSSKSWGNFSETCSAILIEGRWSYRGEELFERVSGSYGVLGRVERIKIETVEAFDVEVTYGGEEEGDLIEGVVFEERRVNVVGNFTKKKGGKLKKSFFQRVLESKKGEKEILSLEDYLFRWDRGAFWMERFLYPWKNALSMVFPWMRSEALKNLSECKAMKAPWWFFRVSTDSLYKVLHQIPKKEEIFLIQDCTVPEEALEEFLRFVREEIGIFPLWLCPIKGSEQPYSFNHGKGPFVNVGIYGACNHAYDCVKKLEKKVFALRGRKMLYSHNEYDLEMFFAIYGRNETTKALFDKVR